MSERVPLDQIYSEELKSIFPTLSQSVETFLQKYGTEIATVDTSPEKIAQWTEALQTLATEIARGLQKLSSLGDTLSVTSALSEMLRPARKTGSVPLGGNERFGILNKIMPSYHVLEKAETGGSSLLTHPRALLLLLQHLTPGIDTGAEIHGVKPFDENGPAEERIHMLHGLVRAQNAGIEVYLPLRDRDEITFFINNEVFKPKALHQLLTILPGDTHHHIQTKGTGFSSVLILGGFGFSKGLKVKEGTSFVVPEFKNIPRLTEIV